jgi:hypothetical protein
MIVYVTGTSNYYKLVGGIADVNWTEFFLLSDIDGGTYT